MRRRKLQNHNQAGGLTIVGSCGVEEIFTASSSKGDHDISTIALSERTFGGAGLCLALAYSRIGSDSPIYFDSVIGSHMSGFDCDGDRVHEYLIGQKFEDVHLQSPEGVVTEKNMIVLKNSRRYGYRLVNQENKIARKSFNAHDPRLLEHFQKSHSVIVTSFSPEMAVMIFKNFARSLRKSGLQKICACYTLNSEIASQLRNNHQLQEELSKHINVLCLSEDELKILDGKAATMYASVPIILVTKGDKGAVIIDNLHGKNEHIVVKAFPVQKSMNDNGAGEAAHAAFIHTLISFKQSILWKTQSLRRMLEISGYVANVAGALKIQAQRSLDFRNNLDYTIALSQCVNTSMKPHMIGAHILNKYVKDNQSHNYYFESTTHQ